MTNLFAHDINLGALTVDISFYLNFNFIKRFFFLHGFYTFVRKLIVALHCHMKAVVTQWIRSRTLNREGPGSNQLAVAVVHLHKTLYAHCLSPRKANDGPLLIYKPLAF